MTGCDIPVSGSGHDIHWGRNGCNQRATHWLNDETWFQGYSDEESAACIYQGVRLSYKSLATAQDLETGWVYDPVAAEVHRTALASFRSSHIFCWASSGGACSGGDQ